MSHLFSKPFTLDRTVRLFLGISLGLFFVFLFRYLSPVLLPFFVAWLLAYLIHPIVVRFQRVFHIKNRTIAVSIVLLLLFSLIGALLYFLIPAILTEGMKLKDSIVAYTSQGENAFAWESYLKEFFLNLNIPNILQRDNIIEIIKEVFPHAWSILSSSVSFALSLFTAFVSLLYLFFLLKDYHVVANYFLSLVPDRYKAFTSTLLRDMEQGMNNYYRGQTLVAMIVGILFAIGFQIIGMPLGILMGIFIGLLNLVPYMQILGIPPCILLMLVHSSECNISPAYSLLFLFIVFAAIQFFQDGFLVPKIMGRTMELNAAVILLSLSIFGMIFGVIGIIIALPLTTLLTSYYKRYILDDVNQTYERETNGQDPESIEQLRS